MSGATADERAGRKAHSAANQTRSTNGLTDDSLVSRVVSKSRIDSLKLVDAINIRHYFNGAGCPNRTDDLPLTRRVLYQLS